MKSISIFYFSGTWGTEEIVKEIRDRISPACKVSLKSIEEHIKADKIPELNEDYTGFAFPIYAFNAPTLVYDFFKRLPDGKGHPCFILNVSGAGGEKTSNAASTHYVKKTLHKKNYDIDRK